MMAKPKARPVRRQPQRTCIICRSTTDKRRLVRIVRAADGTGVLVDERGKVPGRGAYLCEQASCWESALHGHVLDRALNTTLSGEALQALSEHALKFMSEPTAVKENSQ